MRVLSVDGDLVLARAPEIKGLLLEALRDPEPLAVELGGVTRIDTAGVQLLLLLERLAATRGIPLALPAPSPVIAEALSALGLDTHLRAALERAV